MSRKLTNAMAFLIASVGMAFALLGAIGTDPTLITHHQHADNFNEETKR